jgi:hypothetical protein
MPIYDKYFYLIILILFYLVRLPDNNRLFDKLYSFGKLLEGKLKFIKNFIFKYFALDEMNIIHLCDFQFQYQCELFGILSKIIYPKYSHLKQVHNFCCFLSILKIFNLVFFNISTCCNW